MGGQRAVHILRGQRTAVQTETVPILLGRKSVLEYLGHVLLRYSNAIVRDLDPEFVHTMFIASDD